QGQRQAGVNVAVIHQLIRLMSTGDIEEITIEEPAAGMKLTLRKPAPLEGAFSEEEPEPVEVADAAPKGVADPTPLGVREVRGPLVGIFRANMRPGGRPLVSRGSVVREGQIVGAIEALQVYNEVEASEAGTVREVLVRDGQPVEYGQPLLRLAPPQN